MNSVIDQPGARHSRQSLNPDVVPAEAGNQYLEYWNSERRRTDGRE